MNSKRARSKLGKKRTSRKRNSIKRNSIKRNSRKRNSIKRTSRKRTSRKRNSIKRTSRKRNKSSNWVGGYDYPEDPDDWHQAVLHKREEEARKREQDEEARLRYEKKIAGYEKKQAEMLIRSGATWNLPDVSSLSMVVKDLPTEYLNWITIAGLPALTRVSGAHSIDEIRDMGQYIRTHKQLEPSVIFRNIYGD